MRDLREEMRRFRMVTLKIAEKELEEAKRRQANGEEREAVMKERIALLERRLEGERELQTAPIAAAATASGGLEFVGVPNVPWSDIRFNEVTDLIGKGAFGAVYKAMYKGAQVAVKVVDASGAVALERELRATVMVNHPRVVRVVGVATDGKLAVLQEFAPGARCATR